MMKVLLSVVVFAFPLGVAAALAVPVPERRAPQEERVELSGTTWEGPDGPLDVVRFVFEANGVLSYTYKSGAQFRNGTWKADGSTLTFEVNQKYRQFQGTIQGDAIAGDSWNRAGEKWKTNLRRIGPGR